MMTEAEMIAKAWESYRRHVLSDKTDEAARLLRQYLDVVIRDLSEVYGKPCKLTVSFKVTETAIETWDGGIYVEPPRDRPR